MTGAREAILRVTQAEPHDRLARELVELGIVREEDEAKAAAAAARQLGPLRASLSFEKDVEFLLSSISHHVAAYFRQVLAPRVASFHSKNWTGRVIHDSDVNAAAEEISLLVFGEVGDNYCSVLQARYFGDRDRLIAFAYARIRNLLLEEAVKTNNAFLARRAGRHDPQEKKEEGARAA